jgi:hypothetical protein
LVEWDRREREREGETMAGREYGIERNMSKEKKKKLNII